MPRGGRCSRQYAKRRSAAPPHGAAGKRARRASVNPGTKGELDMAEFRTASPGPWEIEEREDCSGFRLIDADGSLIEYLTASRYVDGRHDPEHLENVALMADGPEFRDTLAELRLHAE